MTAFKAYLASVLLLGACSGSIDGDGEGGGDTERDRTAPLIEIDTPVRGTMTSDGEVVVSGRVYDEQSGVESLTINGKDVEFGGDGRFSTTVSLPEGITLIETIAVDKANQDASDLRAVLNGQMAEQGSIVKDAVVANANKKTIDVMGKGIEVLVENTDFASIAKAANPIADVGSGCPGNVKVNVTDVKKGDIELGLSPSPQGLGVDVVLHNLRVDVSVRADACGPIPAVTVTGDVTASAYNATGLLDVDINNSGDIRVSLANLQTNFNNFNWNVNGVPGFVESLARGPVETAVRNILSDQINSIVPTETSKMLNDFAKRTYSIDVLEDTVDIDVEPTEVELTNAGIRIRLDGSTAFRKVEGASFLSTPRPAPGDMESTGGLNLGVADDVANQMLASLWASGMLEEAMGPQLGAQIQSFLGDQASGVQATISLPPVVMASEASSSARLLIGDLLVHVDDTEGGTLVEFAISADIGLKVISDDNGDLKLVTDTGSIRGKLIEKSTKLLLKLDDDTITAIAEVAVQQVTKESDTLLGGIPIPNFGAVMVGAPSVGATEGYLLLDAELTNP